MAIRNGNSSNNTLNGGANDDFIYGKGGNDWLYGKGGNDLLDGGIGRDHLFGGGGTDTLRGGDGNDEMVGGGGDDLMVGGAGGDLLQGAEGWDTVSYSGSASAVLAYLADNEAIGGASGDSFVEVENVIGSAHNDYLQNANGGTAFGGLGADHLFGGGTLNATDEGGRLRGDAGVDTLNMIYGNTSAWLELNKGTDIIEGFVEDQDMFFIDLSDFGLGDALESGEFINSDGVSAVGTNPQFIYENDAEQLWFDSNGTNEGGLVLLAQFQSSTIVNGIMGAGDFETQL